MGLGKITPPFLVQFSYLIQEESQEVILGGGRELRGDVFRPMADIYV